MKPDLMFLAPSIKPYGILPVFCPKNREEAATFTRALLSTPLRVAEITLRNEHAVELIKSLKKEDPTLIVGAGTVLSEELLETAVDAGADFLVSPGYTPSLVEKAAAHGVPFLPGCSTPSEIQNAFIAGNRVLKYFPAECSGGTTALKLYQGAFRDIFFVPTGGISLENLPDYLALPNVLACGGSFMLPKRMLENGDANGIRETILSCLSIRGGATT